MADNSSNTAIDTSSSPGSMEEVSGKIMVAAIIVLFMVIVFVFFLHLYARWFWSRRGAAETTDPTRQRRRRFVFAPNEHHDQHHVVGLRRGLEPSVVRALPVVIFRPDDFKEGLECAVCLSEFTDGEKARLLPKCNHGFHVECIDMWFQSHATCPLCRNTVAIDLNESSPERQSSSSEENSEESGYSIDSPDFPTNVLFWGNQNLDGDGLSTSTSSSSSPNTSQDDHLVIEIPRLIDGLSALSPSVSRFTEDEMKSPTSSSSPMTTRLRSLRRLLSRDKRVIPPSPSSVDVEQGEGGGRGQSSKTSSET